MRGLRWPAAYPTAPDEMVYTAVFHLYVDGASALADVMADAELGIREPGGKLNERHIFHAAYHMYNLMQFLRILPFGKPDLLEAVGEAACVW